MTIAPLVVVALAFGVAAVVVGDRAGSASFAAFGGLALVAVMSALLPTTEPTVTLAGEPVLVDGYVRQFLSLGALGGLLLMLAQASSPRDRGEREAPARHQLSGAAFLLFLGLAAVAMAVPAPLPALFAATAAGFGGLLAAARLAAGVPDPEAPSRAQGASRPAMARMMSTRLGTDLLRGAGALLVATTSLALLISRADVIAGDPFGVGAAALGLAGAVAVRIGVVPLHAHAMRLAESSLRGVVPVLSVWSPALFAVVALAGAQSAVIPVGLPLSIERGGIAGLAILTILLAGLAALVQDDVEHVIAYSILQDLALVFFAFAALDAGAWGPGRAWLLVAAVAKTALLGWAIVVARTFGSRSLADLRGWARRAPLLAAALALITAAAVGVPGFASFEARVALVGVALSDPIRSLVLVASLTTLLVHGRMLVIGVLEPTVVVRAADDERLRRLPPDLRRRVSETARETLEANRAPVAAAFAVALALLAFSAGAGMFGLREAAAGHVPGALPGPEPSSGPEATFRPIPTNSPPPGSAGPTGSGPTGSQAVISPSAREPSGRPRGRTPAIRPA